MPNHSIFTNWHEAYRHLAELLQNAYKENTVNPSEELYNRLAGTKYAALNTGRLFRDKSSFISEWGLDPIQIFASFNYPKIGYKRVEMLNSLLEEFQSDKRVDKQTSFEGCPSPMITHIVRFRGLKVQNEIWEMFNDVMKKGVYGLRSKHFLSLKTWKGVDIASFTMFLFWINSNEFIPLDRNTVDFLKSFNIIIERPRTYIDYYNLCTSKLQLPLPYHTSEGENVIRNFVRDAINFKDRTFEKILSESTAAVISQSRSNVLKNNVELEQEARRRLQERINGFHIIALRPQASLNKEQKIQPHLKNLKQGELYQFYHAYQFDSQNDNKIIYDSNKDINLYDQGDLKISISSIVGKNGSGKSTIAEFLFLVINKLTIAKKIKSSEKLIDEEVYADLFVKLDKLYKITVDSSVRFFEYNLESDNKTYLLSNKETTIANFDLERFCYTIAVNYSLYALNTSIIGDWIYPLFHKNDSYQTPIVLNPLRNEGKIDINNEEALAKSRMLSNILEPDLIDFEKKVIPELIPNSIPTNLILEFDIEKHKRKKAEFEYKRLYIKQINKAMTALGLEDKSDLAFIREAKEYVYLKIVTIADRYSKFRNFKNLPSWISSDAKKLETYINTLNDDTSHITFKLKQAINYLKFGIYREGRNNILQLSAKIRDIKEGTDIRMIELVPPPFFKFNIAFDHGGLFNDLSSGEKQQIFSINTITYHIYNLASVLYEKDSYKYKNINIIFDEVELYFHPEMQRTYISNLLHHIAMLPLGDNIQNINILFITHSPFILSDIPSSNILRLSFNPKTKQSLPANNSEQTFGANIHDLLANDFFLENGFMGKFANDKIQQIVNKLEGWTESDNNNKLKDELYRTIQLIGEPLIKESIMDLFREKIGLHESELSIADIEVEIERLQALKTNLK